MAADTTQDALHLFTPGDFKRTHYLVCRPDQYGKNYWLMYPEGKVPEGVHAIGVPEVARAELDRWSLNPYIRSHGVYVPANVIPGTNHYAIQEMAKPEVMIDDTRVDDAGNEWFTWSQVMGEYEELTN